MPKYVKEICLTCDGAGLLPSKTTWQMNLCKSCNGHGVVMVETGITKPPVKFDVDQSIVCRAEV